MRISTAPTRWRTPARASRCREGVNLSRRQFARRAAEGRRGARRADDRTRMGRGPDPLLERGRLVRVAGAHRREARAAARRRAAPGDRHRHDLGQPVQAAGRRARACGRGGRRSSPSAATFPSDNHIVESVARMLGLDGALRAGGGDRRRDRRRTPRSSSSPTSTIAPPRSRTWRRSPRPRTQKGALIVWDLAHSHRRGRAASRPRSRRLRGRLRLQVSQRRARRARACLCGRAAPRRARPAAHRLVRACGAVRLRGRFRARRRHPRDALLARRRCSR